MYSVLYTQLLVLWKHILIYLMYWLCCQNNTNDVIKMEFDRLIDLSDENSTIVIYSAIWYEEVSRSHLMVDKRKLASSIEMILSEFWPNAKNGWALLATRVVLCMQDGTRRQTSLIPSLILVLYLYPQCALVLSIWSPCKPLHCLLYAGISMCALFLNRLALSSLPRLRFHLSTRIAFRFVSPPSPSLMEGKSDKVWW